MSVIHVCSCGCVHMCMLTQWTQCASIPTHVGETEVHVRYNCFPLYWTWRLSTQLTLLVCQVQRSSYFCSSEPPELGVTYVSYAPLHQAWKWVLGFQTQVSILTRQNFYWQSFSLIWKHVSRGLIKAALNMIAWCRGAQSCNMTKNKCVI